jgi:hypothetical protein
MKITVKFVYTILVIYENVTIFIYMSLNLFAFILIFMKKINSNLINQIEPSSIRDTIRSIADEMEGGDLAEKTSKIFYPLKLSRELEPYIGQFILGSHFQGYGGTPEHDEVLGQKIPS